MAKLETRRTAGLFPAPRIAKKVREQVDMPSPAADANAYLDALAWMLDGNGGPIPRTVLERLNAPRHRH
jgi:hypothetical protein